jgi:hypothetical protein
VVLASSAKWEIRVRSGRGDKRKGGASPGTIFAEQEPFFIMIPLSKINLQALKGSI